MFFKRDAIAISKKGTLCLGVRKMGNQFSTSPDATEGPGFKKIVISPGAIESGWHLEFTRSIWSKYFQNGKLGQESEFSVGN